MRMEKLENMETTCKFYGFQDGHLIIKNLVFKDAIGWGVGRKRVSKGGGSDIQSKCFIGVCLGQTSLYATVFVRSGR